MCRRQLPLLEAIGDSHCTMLSNWTVTLTPGLRRLSIWTLWGREREWVHEHTSTARNLVINQCLLLDFMSCVQPNGWHLHFKTSNLSDIWTTVIWEELLPCSVHSRHRNQIWSSASADDPRPHPPCTWMIPSASCGEDSPADWGDLIIDRFIKQ